MNLFSNEQIRDFSAKRVARLGAMRIWGLKAKLIKAKQLTAIQK